MRIPVRSWAFPAATALIAAALASALSLGATVDSELIARARLFPSITSGVTAIRRDPSARYLVLTQRGGVAVFDANGQQAGHIPADPAPYLAIQYGSDLDVDAQGQVYVADRAANLVDIYDSHGKSVRDIRVPGPIAVAALGGGEVAVVNLRSPKLVMVFGADGQETREFGEPAQISGREDLNRLANLGRLCRDSAGHIFYSFTYLPEPTVRRYDRFGYSDFQLVISTEDYIESSMAARRTIVREEDKSKGAPELHTILGPVAVDQGNGEIWLAIGGRLLRYSADGTPLGSYLIYTPDEARIEASALLIEPNRIVVGTADKGVFDLPHPPVTGP